MNDWIIAVGHHQANQINVQDFTGLLLAKNINLYLNGHTHALKHYQIDGNKNIDWVTTGAGCMVHTYDQDTCDTQDCAGLNDARYTSDHKVEELFYKRVSGFTVHTFSDDFSSLTTNYLDTNGNSIHSFVTSKTSQVVV